MHDVVMRPYGDCRGRINDGDLLLFRPRRPTTWLIARAGRSEYCHAGMAAWWGERLMCLETVQWRGGRAVLLSNLVKAHPGRIDVYAPAAGRIWYPKVAVNQMLEITGRPYGWRSLVRAAVSHMVLLRLLFPPITDDQANGSLPFCSQAVARAYRIGGVDPVPNLADRMTEPGDLARSPFFQYRFTLTGD